MDEHLSHLYQQVILEHNKHPRNFGELASCTHTANGHNPVCGDTIRLFLQINEGLVEEVQFVGQGCAISQASASVLTTLVKGKTKEEAEALATQFLNDLTGVNVGPRRAVDSTSNNETASLPTALQAFHGVREFPARVKCASLPWRTLEAALHQVQEVTTE